MNILYIEDNAVNLSLIERIAQMNNHHLISYPEAEIALEKLDGLEVDLILLDILLAGEMDGIEFARELRKRGDTHPIIAITAHAMMGDKERIIEAGCNEYLPKPLPIAEFLTLLAKYEAQIKAQGSASVATASEKPASAPASKSITPAPSAEQVAPTSAPSEEETGPISVPSAEQAAPTSAPSEEETVPISVPSAEQAAPTSAPSEEETVPISVPSAEKVAEAPDEKPQQSKAAKSDSGQASDSARPPDGTDKKTGDPSTTTAKPVQPEQQTTSDKGTGADALSDGSNQKIDAASTTSPEAQSVPSEDKKVEPSQE